jgi:uncharacterized protein (DUF1778 family)
MDLDQELLRDAAEVLGTTRTVETVHAALRDVVARRRRAMLVAHDFTDLTLPALESMRAVRTVTDRPVARPRPTSRPR